MRTAFHQKNHHSQPPPPQQTTSTRPNISITMAVETQTPTTSTTSAAPRSPGMPRRIIDGVDTHTADGAAVFPFATIHANHSSLSSSSSHGRRHVVLQSGIIPDTNMDHVRAVFLDIRNIWKWQWDTERIEILHTISDDDDDDDKDNNESLPVPLHHEQRAYHYPKNQNATAAQPSDAPIVQKVVAVTQNAVKFWVDSRPPLRNVQVTLSIEPSTTEQTQGTKARVGMTRWRSTWFILTCFGLSVSFSRTAYLPSSRRHRL